MKQGQTERTPRAGFTLVELALTALVIGLGVLAVFGLGRLGMQSAADTENDARCALLANDILATLRAASDDVCRTGGPAAFAEFWTTLRDNADVAVSFPAAGAPAVTNWIESADPDVGRGIRGGSSVSFVRLAAQTPLDEDPIDEWSAQFWLNIEVESTVSAPTNMANLVRLSLNIRPDAFSSRGASRSFYAHIIARTLWP